MSQEVSLSSFVITIDSIQNGVDLPNFYEYIKTNYKKEVVFINASELGEFGGRGGKTDPKSDKKSKFDANSLIARGIKQKIESDSAKILDSKKKQIAAAEKAKIQAASGKPGKTKPRTTEGKLTTPFDSVIDVLFILVNFPYLPSQIKELSNNGVDLGAFFAIVPEKGADYNPYQKKIIDKSARTPIKKSPIPGLELDSSSNPSNYPPPRWDSIRPFSPISSIFVELSGSNDFEKLFSVMEEKIISIIQTKEQFLSQFATRKFLSLPSVTIHNDLSDFIEFISYHTDDYVNALYYQLKVKGFVTSNRPPAKTIKELFDSIFSKSIDSIARKVVFYDKKESIEPVFNSEIPHAAYEVVYQLTKWNLKNEYSLACNAISRWIASPDNLYIYIAQKFDQMVLGINKKRQLGLPLAFFDFQHWNYSTEHLNVFDALQDAISVSSVVETLVDESVGIQCVLTLAPVAKNNGNVMTRSYFPPTLDGFSDYLKYFVENNNIPEKKIKGNLNPQAIAKEGGDPSILLPSIKNQFSNPNENIYRLPLPLSRSNKCAASYVFDTKTRVEINRDVQTGQLTFGYSVFHNDLFAIYCESDQIVISLVEGLKIIYHQDFSVTILFIEQSIYYDGKDIILKSSNEPSMVITENHSFLCTDDNNCPLVVLPDGTINHFVNGNWQSVSPDGELSEKDGDKYTKVPSKYAKITDIKNHSDFYIRPDGIEYYVKDDGSRRILFKIDFSIEQHRDKTLFDISQFPIIQVISTEKSMSINRFEISFDGRSASISCNDYTIAIDEDRVFVKSEKVLFNLKPKRCEIKSNDTVLVADENGTQCVGTITEDIAPKKKVEVIPTVFGNVTPTKETLSEPQLVDLHHIFAPRFFVIRTDFGATEFYRYDCIPKEGFIEKPGSIIHSRGCECDVVSFHSTKPEEPAKVFVKHKPMNKTERTSRLKGLFIPKKSKQTIPTPKSIYEDEVNFIEAEGLRQSSFYDTKVFAQALEGYIDRAHEQFLEENTPPAQSKPEIPLLPPQTPSPRILMMQKNKYIPKPSLNTMISYWDSPEAAFSYPTEQSSVKPKDLSPRVNLFDPPRFFNDSFEPPVEVAQPKSPKSVMKPSTRQIKTPPKSPSLLATPHSIVFGNIKSNTASTVSIYITNTGSVPLHYTLTQPNHPLLKVLTPPGVVYPGLKMKLEVSLQPGAPQNISSMFLLKTSMFTITIPVTGTIVE